MPVKCTIFALAFVKKILLLQREESFKKPKPLEHSLILVISTSERLKFVPQIEYVLGFILLDNVYAIKKITDYSK